MSLAKARSFVLELIKQHGNDPISVACLQPGLEYFTTSFGVQAYKKIGRSAITLGPPICESKDQQQMLSRFMQTNKNPIFCYLPDQIAKQLRREGLFLAGMGIDRYVNHSELLNTPSKVTRGALKHAQKANLKISEVCPNTLSDRERSYFSAIQQSYLADSNLKCII